MRGSVDLDAARTERAAEQARHEHHKKRLAHPLFPVYRQLTEESLRETEKERWRVKHRDFGNGHKEAVLFRHRPDPWRTLDRAIERDIGPSPEDPEEEVDKQGNVDRAVRRAKQQVRHICKTMGVNSLWTLTFKANVTDRKVAAKCLDAFRRRVQKILPGWKYCAIAEKQERGALHWHLATHALPRMLTRDGVKVKSWDLMRSVWLLCTGDLGGNFDEAKRSGRWGAKGKRFTRAGQIAGYIAGYVAKDMRDSPENAHRFRRSLGVEIPPALVEDFKGDVAMLELLELAYAAVGTGVVARWYDSGREVFYVESDDSR